MAQLPEEKRKAQQFYATRAIVVRFANQQPGEPAKKMFDNQYVYKLKKLKGYPPHYWEAHFKNYLKKNAPLVLEAAMFDVSKAATFSAENRIAQLVTNGNFLY